MSEKILRAIEAVSQSTERSDKIQKKTELGELMNKAVNIKLDFTDADGLRFKKEDEYLKILSEALETNTTIKSLNFNFSPDGRYSCALNNEAAIGYFVKALKTNITLEDIGIFTNLNLTIPIRLAENQKMNLKVELSESTDALFSKQIRKKDNSSAPLTGRH